MGKLHHAMMGTAAVAIGTAAAIPGTLVNLAAGGGERNAVRFGHPSGMLRVGAEASQVDGEWTRHQGHHEPQRPRADGRVDPGAVEHHRINSLNLSPVESAWPLTALAFSLSSSS